MANVMLFTHTDLDGIGCAVVASTIYGCYTYPAIYVDGGGLEYKQCNYDEINEVVSDFLDCDICKYNLVFITDISVNEEVAEKIDKINKNAGKINEFYTHIPLISLFDHHPTAMWLNKYNWANVVVEENGVKTCGTELFYKFLAKEYKYFPRKEKEEFVNLVRMHDTWTWNNEENGLCAKQMNDLYYIYGPEKFIEWAGNKVCNGESFYHFNDADKMLLENKQNDIDKYINKKSKNIVRAKLCGYNCGIVYSSQYTSELGHRICSENPDLDFVCMIDLSDGTVSYRSANANKVDLGKDIAKLYGGGGHPCAAGSTIQNDYNNVLLKCIFGENIEL